MHSDSSTNNVVEENHCQEFPIRIAELGFWSWYTEISEFCHPQQSERVCFLHRFTPKQLVAKGRRAISGSASRSGLRDKIRTVLPFQSLNFEQIIHKFAKIDSINLD